MITLHHFCISGVKTTLDKVELCILVPVELKTKCEWDI